jgi:hypothetical protein
MTLCIASYVDRTAIGFAIAGGMNQDLGTVSSVLSRHGQDISLSKSSGTQPQDRGLRLEPQGIRP